MRPLDKLRQLLGCADVIRTIGFSTAIIAYNGRFITEAFYALLIILCLECAHIHFMLFNIADHNALHFLCFRHSQIIITEYPANVIQLVSFPLRTTI